MRKAVINSEGVVENIIKADDKFSIRGKSLVKIDDEIVNIGFVYSDGKFSDPNPPPEKGLDELISEKEKEISSLRDKKYKEGFNYQGKNFQIDLEAQKDMTAVQVQFLLGQEDPHGGFWRTTDNEAVRMNDVQVKLFFQNAFSYVLSIKQASWNHKENVKSLNDRDLILEYNTSIGWPSNNG